MIDDPALRARVQRALEAAQELQQKGALPPVLTDLLLLLGDGGADDGGDAEGGVGARGARTGPPGASVTESLIRTLWAAEERLSFVALSFLRDKLLPEAAGIPANAAVTAIHEALKDGILLTDRIENPRNAKRPTTTVRLNRAHPAVRALVPEAAAPEPFEPVDLRGASLSSTVMEDRR